MSSDETQKPLENDVKDETIYSEDLTEQFQNMIETINTFKSSMSALQTQIKFLEKGVRKELHQVHKTIKKKKTGNKKPSGFATPSPISKELCKFMGIEPNSEVARTVVTRHIIQYIRDNNLQYPENKRIIIPDKELSLLLGVEDDTQTVVTYFNIQRFMNKHFIKKEASQ
jgi:chromatin remodeling complex protein RSC6